MAAGKIKWYDDAMGYGFITGDNGQEIFLHHTGILNRRTTKLEKGTRVSFTETEGERGPKAVDVRVSER